MQDPARLLTEARAQLAAFVPALERLLGGLDAGAWRARPAEKEWAPVEILCHLRDEETEDFGARLRVIVEGGPGFAPIDPPRWAVERAYLDADGPAVLTDLGRRRAATLVWLGGVPPERLTRAIEHPGAGRLSGLDLLAAWVAHDRLHLAQLAAALARTWTTRWAPLRTEYAGPIPYAQ
jgi:DinB superfamily